MAKKQPKTIKASRELQAKVGTGQIDEKKIEEAQKIMDEDDTEFSVLAKDDLAKLQQAIDSAKKSLDDEDAVMQSFKTPIMNLKANAGSFKYEFVSSLTGMVLMLLETVEKPDKKLVKIVDSLHKTILLALASEMKGDGGKAGQELIGAFKDVCRKYTAGEDTNVP